MKNIPSAETLRQRLDEIAADVQEESLARGLREGKVSTPRKGKRVAVFSYNQLEEHEGQKFSSRLVVRVTERTIDRRGQRLLNPDIKVEGWWTSLYLPEQEIIGLYNDHGTSEQFHSEFKTDLDLERLPSGKFSHHCRTYGAFREVYGCLAAG